jgi:LmbE family N-acetylglucosaminyl deacetylase
VTTNGHRLLAKPVREGGTAAERWLAWGNQSAELDLDGCDTLVVVSAHADDETLGLGATMSVLGDRAQVVCATDSLTDRRPELTQACRILGTAPPIFLGLPEGQLAWHARDLAERLVELLDPSDWVAAPWRGDGDPDHAAAGEAALWAATRADCYFIEYPVWMWHWAEPDDPDVPWEDTATIVSPVSAWSKKRAAIQAYGSQITGVDPALPPAVIRRAMMLPEVVFV